MALLTTFKFISSDRTVLKKKSVSDSMSLGSCFCPALEARMRRWGGHWVENSLGFTLAFIFPYTPPLSDIITTATLLLAQPPSLLVIFHCPHLLSNAPNIDVLQSFLFQKSFRIIISSSSRSRHTSQVVPVLLCQLQSVSRRGNPLCFAQVKALEFSSGFLVCFVTTRHLENTNDLGSAFLANSIKASQRI